jgi:hypothetical protein
VADEKTTVLTKKLSPKTAAIIALAAVVVIGAALLGPGLFRKWTNRPPTATEVHNTLWNYLDKRSGEKDYTVDWSSETNETAQASAGSPDQPRGKKKLRPPQAIYSKYFKQKQDEVSSYKQVYKLIGQELKLADGLLASPEPEQKQTALILATEASRYANDPGGDAWLAARICEGYLWANLDLAESAEKPVMSVEQILNACDMAFKEAGETNNIIRNYKFLIAKSKGTQPDISRFRLARVLEDQGDYAEALVYLRQITNTNKNRLQQTIAALEQKVKTAKM